MLAAGADEIDARGFDAISEMARSWRSICVFFCIGRCFVSKEGSVYSEAPSMKCR